MITASLVGEKGHASLLETLKVIEANIADETQLLISHAKLKVRNDSKITDAKTLAEVETLVHAFDNIMRTNSNAE